MAKQLGVDAVAVVYIVISKEKMNKNDHGINAAHLFVFGPNPKSEGETDANRGQFYAASRVYFKDSKNFHEHKTNNAEYQGFANLFNAMARKSGNWIINKSKK